MPKLAPKRHGPFTIVKRVSPVAYQLQLPMAWTIHYVFHASLLTPYHETTEHGTNYTRPPPDLIEDAKEYEVEAIVNHRHFGCEQQLQYLIKWKGYPDADNTSESADHVHTPTLIQAYHWKNPLSPSEQDKRGQKKRKVSIRSLKSHLQQHPHSTTTCLPPLKPTLPFTTSRPLPQKTPFVQSSRPPPLPSSIHPPFLFSIHQPLNPSTLPLNAHISPSPLTPTWRRARVSRVRHHNYPLSPQSSLNVMQGHPELDAGTLHTIAISLANTAIGRTFQHLEAKSEIEQLCKELTDLRAEMSHQPDSECPDGFEENHSRLPDFTIPAPTASCAKRATSNWAMAQSPSLSAPSARKTILFSSTTCSPPPPTSMTLPPSRYPCGSSTPFRASQPRSTKPWSWPAVRTIGVWQLSSPDIIEGLI